MTNEELHRALKAVIARIEETKDELTELDNAIGDGDHGINLARGFSAVAEKLPGLTGDLGATLKAVGMTLVSTVGGASGPLYGTAFMKAGNALKGKTEATAEDLLAAAEAALKGIKMRGKATEGEKTMLDALCPALAAAKTAAGEGKAPKEILAAAIAAARAGAEHTKDIIATKGRASYLGERSLGHQDPGATSALYMLEAIASTIS